MQLRTNDGETYSISGSTITLEGATALVETMRHGSRTPSQSIEEFMQQVSHRCNLQNGSNISTENTEQFVADLLKAGFLKRVA
jgi:hypothetical protein